MSKHYLPKFTIFTPCYNGEKTIRRVFESIANQTYSDFEWIIINDGSTDKSKETIDSLLDQYPLLKDKTIFICQNNQGKHRAWNRAVSMARGLLFLPADCDDKFKPETLSFFSEAWDKYGDDSVSGVNVCCYNPDNGNLVGSLYPKDGMYSNNIELTYKYKVKGEHWGCIRTDLLKDRPFPKVEGHFFSENYLWYDLALEYKVVCFNKALRAYYYEPESLSNNIAHKINRVDALNRFRYQKWEIKTVGKIVFSISPIAYFKMYYLQIRSVAILVVSLINSKIKVL